MNLRSLDYFISVCDYEGFTNSSENIYVSQSALSKAIANLENELSTTLIDRSTKKFTLTNSGKLLYEEGKNLLKTIDCMKEDIERKLSRIKAKIVIGIAPVISTAYFGKIMYEVKKKFSDVEFEIVEEGANKLEKLLQDGHIDFATVIRPLKKEDFYDVYDIRKDEIALLVNVKDSLANNFTISLEDLQNKNLLLLSQDYMLHCQILQRLEDAKVNAKVVKTSSQWDFLCESVANNEGISILPAPILRKFRVENTRIIPFKDKFSWDVVLIKDKKKSITSSMQNFIDYIEKFDKTSLH